MDLLFQISAVVVSVGVLVHVQDVVRHVVGFVESSVYDLPHVLVGLGLGVVVPVRVLSPAPCGVRLSRRG